MKTINYFKYQSIVLIILSIINIAVLGINILLENTTILYTLCTISFVVNLSDSISKMNFIPFQKIHFLRRIFILSWIITYMTLFIFNLFPNDTIYAIYNILGLSAYTYILYNDYTNFQDIIDQRELSILSI